MMVSMRWLANLNQGHNYFPHNLWSRANILFIIKVHILVLIHVHVCPPPPNYDY